MATAEPPGGGSPANGGAAPAPATGPTGDVTPGGEAPKNRRNPWMWVSAALAVVAVALLAWGLNTKSDLDSAHQQIKDLEAQINHGKEAGGAAAASYQAAYQDLEQQLGMTSADLAATE